MTAPTVQQMLNTSRSLSQRQFYLRGMRQAHPVISTHNNNITMKYISMAKFLKSMADAMNLEVLHKYVLNACTCRSECCAAENSCLCSCQTQEIHHEPEDNDLIGCMKLCCGTAEEIEDDVLSEERDPHLSPSGDIYKEWYGW